MTSIRITASSFVFVAKLETAAAPKTRTKFLTLLRYPQRIIHARWSGEACWIPLGDIDLGLTFENHTSFPAPGDVILSPGGISETEFLLAYGAVRSASKVSQLAGNHFLTIIQDHENLPQRGERVLWHGAQDIAFGAA